MGHGETVNANAFVIAHQTSVTLPNLQPTIPTICVPLPIYSGSKHRLRLQPLATILSCYLLLRVLIASSSRRRKEWCAEDLKVSCCIFANLIASFGSRESELDATHTPPWIIGIKPLVLLCFISQRI